MTKTTEKSPRDGRDTRWAAHRAARRRELLVSARRAIHRLGPEASMEEIAQQAGTSKSVFYRYFSDKNGLGQALGEFLLEGLEARIQAAAAEAEAEDEVVRRMINAYLEMVQRSPAIHEFVTGQSGLAWTRPEESGRPTASLGLFADHVTEVLLAALRGVGAERVAAGGPAHPDGAAGRYWARGVVGMVHSVAETWRRDQRRENVPTRGEVVGALTEWVLAPVHPPPHGHEHQQSADSSATASATARPAPDQKKDRKP